MTDIKPDVTITDLPDASPSDPLEALSWLGETVEEVAEGLRARGIKGERWEPSACPLAIYLQLWYPTACVAMGTAWEKSDLGMNWTCPPGAEEFEIAFDDGNFPDLIAFDG